MTQTHELRLSGCTPEPLMSYLKALGILRLVSEQKDADATGCWRNDEFVLRSSLDREELIHFFLKEYQPTPILAPWNGGSGFYKKWDLKTNRFKSRDSAKALEYIMSTDLERFSSYKIQIEKLLGALVDIGEVIDLEQTLNTLATDLETEGAKPREIQKMIKEYIDNSLFIDYKGKAIRIKRVDKDSFLHLLRSKILDDVSMGWLDASFVLSMDKKKSRIEAPYLGTGGNIGNSDFSARFMKLLLIAFEDTAKSQLLESALFQQRSKGLLEISIDQFDPGCAGGTNMGQGLSASPSINLWNYILMIEGSILFRGASSKRFGSSVGLTVFPFSVTSSSGFVSCGPEETRGELWLPLWPRFTSVPELSVLLSEGRSYSNKNQAKNGLDMIKAVSDLGTDRGINEFSRVQFQKRYGDNYFANILGRMKVGYKPSTSLLNQFDGWLDQLRREAAGGNAPARYQSIVRNIESAIFDYCRFGGKERLTRILLTLGAAQRHLALTLGKVGQSKFQIKPLSKLKSAWLDAIDNSSIEFELALSVAGLYDPSGKIQSFRSNLESVESTKNGWWNWASNPEPRAVWKQGGLPSNLSAVLQRRLMDGNREGSNFPPLASRFHSSLDAISSFIAGEIDDQYLEDLIWALILITPGKFKPVNKKKTHTSPPLPRQFALLKLVFLYAPLIQEPDQKGIMTWRFARKDETGVVIRPEPRILPLLRAGRIGEACDIAHQRLVSSGFQPLGSVAAWNAPTSSDALIDARRLAAALLFPISNKDLNQIIAMVTHKSDETDELVSNAEGEFVS